MKRGRGKGEKEGDKKGAFDHVSFHVAPPSNQYSFLQHGTASYTNTYLAHMSRTYIRFTFCVAAAAAGAQKARAVDVSVVCLSVERGQISICPLTSFFRRVNERENARVYRTLERQGNWLYRPSLPIV